MQIDAIKSACTNAYAAGALGTLRDIDADRFLASPTPAAAIGLPYPETALIVCADGSTCLIETAQVAPDFDGFRTPSPAPLADIAAQEHTLDYRDLPTHAGTDEPALFAHDARYVLAGLTAGARRQLAPKRPDSPLAEIAAGLRRAGHRPDTIAAAIERHAENLAQPLFRPRDETSWQADAADAVESLTADFLTAHPAFSGGQVLLRARHGDTDADLLVEGRPAAELTETLLPILDAALDLSRRFTGIRNDYNDGPVNRRDGYTAEGAPIFAAYIPDASHHERLAARERVIARLRAAAIDPATISGLTRF